VAYNQSFLIFAANVLAISSAARLAYFWWLYKLYFGGSLLVNHLGSFINVG